MKNNDGDRKKYNVTKRGSLGLLAYGDLGFKAWRKVKTKKQK